MPGTPAGQPLMEEQPRVSPSNTTNVLLAKNLLDLPEKLLVKVLAWLDGTTLKTARLVCRRFRAASIPSISGISVICRDDTNPGTFDRLQGFTSLENLVLRISLPRDWPLLQCPRVISKLRKLDLFGVWDEGPAAPGLLVDLAQTLAPATRLTALALRWGQQLAHVLGACPSVQKLEIRLGNYMLQDQEGFAQAVLEPPNLAAFCASSINIGWRGLLPSISQLTRLQALEHVPLMRKADIEALAVLTQLTRLSIVQWYDHWLEMTLLSSLSLLQSFSYYGEMDMTTLRELVEPMRQLQELNLKLTVPLLEFHCENLDSLLASLSRLTQLALTDSAGLRPVPRAPVPKRVGANFALRGIAGLRALHYTLPEVGQEDMAVLIAALTGLHRLEVTCDTRTCRQLALHLHSMPCLTELVLKAHAYFHPGWWSYTSGRILVGLTRLRHLCLWDVLNPMSWDDDVAYIAALTDLRSLEIHCEVHGNYQLTAAQFLPLTVLRQLELLNTSRRWGASIAEPEFRDAQRESRAKMGLPVTDICVCGPPAW
eukprot:jgi/Botrbrau1/11534/Bobra.0393s0013.1